MTATNIDRAETITNPTTTFDGGVTTVPNTGKPESELRAAVRRHGLTLKELASLMGVNYGHLCSVANGHRPWTPNLREKVVAVLGVVPGQGVVYRQGGVINGDSSFIRERAREIGLSMKALAHRVGVSAAYMTQVSRGQRNMSPAVQAKVEAELGAPVRIEAAEFATLDPRALWDRMDAHGFSQNETARLAGISSAHLSNIMNGKATPSGEVLRKLHGVLFQPSSEDLVVPAEVKVMAWKKGGRNGGVVRSADGPEPRRRHRPHRRAGSLGRRGGVRLPRRLRQPGPGVSDPPGGREGLPRHAEPAGARCCLNEQGRVPNHGTLPLCRPCMPPFLHFNPRVSRHLAAARHSARDSGYWARHPGRAG